jgi:hypothetical protein
MKKTRVLLRFPNEWGWIKFKLNLNDLKVVRVFDDEIFAFIGDTCISIKRDSLPKSFVIQKGDSGY